MIKIVIPIKPLAVAKSRLAPVLSNGERSGLVLAMLRDVLDAATGSAADTDIVVISSDADVRMLASGYSIQCVSDGAATGYNEAVKLGMEQAAAEGASAVLVLPADLPLITAADIEQLIGVGGENKVVIVPDREDSGSNALLIAPPLAMLTEFGQDSFSRHQARAKELGLSVEILTCPGLALDIDTPDDLKALLGEPRDCHTQSYLKSANINSTHLAK